MDAKGQEGFAIEDRNPAEFRHRAVPAELGQAETFSHPLC